MEYDYILIHSIYHMYYFIQFSCPVAVIGILCSDGSFVLKLLFDVV